MTTPHDLYVTDDAHGDGWHLMLGDSCERLAEIPDASIDLSVCSPPFAQLYNYSPSPRDLSNTKDRVEFFEHYSFIIAEQLRVTKPGRLSCVHVQQITRQKIMHGVIGLTDFRGQVIRAHEEAGWTFWGEATIDKDPQAQAIRTKASTLLFVTKERDQSHLRPALADYLLVFKAPGDNATPVRSGVTNEEWIEWARPTWASSEAPEDDVVLASAGLQRCWYGIRETNTLNVQQARDDADERHICPLQLDLIERVVRLWSNPGETVLSPFAGVGSEGYVSLRHRRRFVGCELKASYYDVARQNLEKAVAERDAGTLFEGLEEVAGAR